MSSIPHTWVSVKGRNLPAITRLHEQYGSDAVRIAPNILSFASSTAFKDVLAIKPGKASFPKDGNFFNTPPNGVHSILTQPNDTDHARYRRLLAHGFSEKAMREQEPLIAGYVDLLIKGLQERTATPQDMMTWYNWTTFDLIGDLTFNESFDCLKKAETHPWIEFVFGGVKAAHFLTQSRSVPPLGSILRALLGKKITAARATGAKFANDKVEHRVNSTPEHTDFLGYVLKHDGKDTGMSREEIVSTSTILILGGSETTATLLTATTYYLLKNPKVMSRLLQEIRGTFQKEEDINFASVSHLKYLMAVLEEAMRMLPPAPLGSPRIVPGKGQTIAGHWVPGGVSRSLAIPPAYYAKVSSLL